MEKLKQMTDDMLVTLYLEGNNSAFDILLNRHQDRLFNYIFFLVRSREVAEDIFQETFVKAITTLQQGRYQNDGKFAAWITRIAHNLVIDQFRIERNENAISNDEAEFDLLNDAKFAEGKVRRRHHRKQDGQRADSQRCTRSDRRASRLSARGGIHALLSGPVVQRDCRHDGCEHKHSTWSHALCSAQHASYRSREINIIGT